MSQTSVPIERLLAHREWVRALARSLVRDPSDADDLEQEAWLDTLRHPPRHDAGLRGWFRALLRSRARDAWRGGGRRAAREAAATPPPAVPTPEETVAQAEAHRRVVDAVLSLEEPYRATVLLRYFEGLPPREVAARMGVPVETVRTRGKRALERLREMLDRDHRGDRGAWMAILLPLARRAEDGPLPPSPGPGHPVPWLTSPALAAAGAGVLLAGGFGIVALRGRSAPPRPAGEVHARVSGGGVPAAEPPASPEAPPAESAMPAAAVPDSVPAAAVPPRATIPVRVLDMADGRPVEGLALVASLAGGTSLQATSDGTGSVLLPAEGMKGVLPRAAAWRCPNYAEGEILAAGEMWVYRMIPVEGEVWFESPERALNPASVELQCSTFDRASLVQVQEREKAPWGAQWLRTHGFEERLLLPHPDVDGSFFARVPRIRGARLLAWAQGWIGDAAPVPADAPGEEPVRMDLVLRDAPRVAGVLRDDAGAPVAGARVEFHQSLRIPAAEAADLARRLRPRGGYGIRTRDDEAILSFLDSQATADDGSFEFLADAAGTGLLAVAPPTGYRPLTSILGRIEETSLQVDLALQRLDETRRVRLIQGGIPLCSGRVGFQDLSCGDAEPWVGMTTDDRGEVAAESLETGHRYRISLEGSQRFPEIVWKGEPGDLDLADFTGDR